MTSPIGMIEYEMIRYMETQDTGHPPIKNWHIMHAADRMEYIFSGICEECEKYFYARMTAESLRGNSRGYDPMVSIRYMLDDLVRCMRGCVCRSLIDFQLLGERVTELLTEAGPKGMPYMEVVRSVVMDQGAPGTQLSAMIDDLGFAKSYRDGKTWIALPAEHINRDHMRIL